MLKLNSLSYPTHAHPGPPELGLRVGGASDSESAQAPGQLPVHWQSPAAVRIMGPYSTPGVVPALLRGPSTWVQLECQWAQFKFVCHRDWQSRAGPGSPTASGTQPGSLITTTSLSS